MFFNLVSEWEGEVLDMARISRLDMGAYLCIASNGVPPTVSKRVKVSVDCESRFNYIFNYHYFIIFMIYSFSSPTYAMDTASVSRCSLILQRYFRVFH